MPYSDAGYTDCLAEDLFNEVGGSQHRGKARYHNVKLFRRLDQVFMIQSFRNVTESCFS
jgi:hypothetical protein